MTKSQIAEHLAGKIGLTKKATAQLLDDLAALAYRESYAWFQVSRPRDASPQESERPAWGRNPQTGAVIKIPAKKVVKFRIAKVAKDAIHGK